MRIFLFTLLLAIIGALVLPVLLDSAPPACSNPPVVSKLVKG